jgi:hypothetical protein
MRDKQKWKVVSKFKSLGRKCVFQINEHPETKETLPFLVAIMLQEDSSYSKWNGKDWVKEVEIFPAFIMLSTEKDIDQMITDIKLFIDQKDSKLFTINDPIKRELYSLNTTESLKNLRISVNTTAREVSETVRKKYIIDFVDWLETLELPTTDH